MTQRAVLISITSLRSGAGMDYDIIGHQPSETMGDVLETHRECDTMTPWYRVQFVSFGQGSITGWVRADAVRLLPVEGLRSVARHVSSDSPAITVLDSENVRKKKHPFSS